MGHTPRYKQGDDWVDGETIWFKVTVWEQLPEILFAKGTAVIVSGELRQESWKTDNDETRTGLTIIASSVGLLHRVVTAKETPGATPWPTVETPTVEDTPF